MTKKLPIALFLMRLALFISMAVFAIDKLVRPSIAAEYFWLPIPWYLMWVFGIVQLILAVALLVGFKKFWTYGLALLWNIFTAIAIWRELGTPFEGYHPLFYAIFPVIAAAWALWSLREYDSLLTVEPSIKE